MWLSSVQIRGFKSFAERFELSFSQGITGMVGPAGWGRTNLIEAIRWALGEPSL
ncbi:MAG: AAA family ATPase, partial [Roseibacillus sp.]